MSESADSRNGRDGPGQALPSVWLALVPVAFLVGALFVTIRGLGLSAHLPLVLATAVAGGAGRLLGVRWPRLLEGIVAGITVALPAVLILMIIGTLIGTWILSGIVPTLIVYGLQVVSPAYFLATSCVVCAIVALATGSSWSTAGTVGIALVGIGSALGVPAGMTAGAIISGAYFGDKMSPLSDTTNLAPAVAGTDLFTHIRHMVYTAGPSLVIALGIFLALGLRFQGGGAQASDVQRLVQTLEHRFSVHWALLLPLLAVIGLVVAKVPALPALLLGAVIGGGCAAVAQGASLQAIGAAAQSGYTDHQLAFGLDGAARVALLSAPLTEVLGPQPALAAQGRTVGVVGELLARGGLQSMMSTVALILCALSFGGVMERTGLLQALAQAILRGARRTGSLVLRTLLTCIGMNVLAADQYMAIVIPGRMYREAFAARKLHPKNLSRALEDSGTMTSALVPWNTCGAYMSTTLGVATWAYAPFAFVNLFNPVLSAFYGYTGLTMHLGDPSESASASESEPESASESASEPEPEPEPPQASRPPRPPRSDG